MSTTSLEERLIFQEELLAKEYLEIAAGLTEFANRCRSKGNLRQAERLYLRALSIFQEMDPTHPKMKVCLRNHARLLDEMDATFRSQDARISRARKSLSTA
jgi:hypothetical protein